MTRGRIGVVLVLVACADRASVASEGSGASTGASASGTTTQSGAGDGEGDSSSASGSASGSSSAAWPAVGPPGMGIAVAVDGTGHVAVAGYELLVNGPGDFFDTDLWVGRFTPEGALSWSHRVDGGSDSPYFQADTAHDVAVDAELNVFVIGTLLVDDYSDSDAVVLAYASDGSELWRHDLAGSYGSYDAGAALVPLRSGDVVAVGYDTEDIRYVPAGSPKPRGDPYPVYMTEVWARRYSGDGAEQWEFRWRPDPPETAWAEAADGVLAGDDTLWIVGASAASHGDPHQDTLIRLDLDGGLIDMSVGEQSFVIEAAAPRSDDSVWLAGFVPNLDRTREGWAGTFSSSFEPLESFTVSDGDEVYLTSIATRGDGFVVGGTRETDGVRSRFVRRYDQDGTQRWEQTRDDGSVNDVAFDENGDVLATGYDPLPPVDPDDWRDRTEIWVEKYDG